MTGSTSESRSTGTAGPVPSDPALSTPPPAGPPTAYDAPSYDESTFVEPGYDAPTGDESAQPTDGQSHHPAPGFNERGKVAAGKISGLWIGLIVAAVFVILLIIFIAQNSRQTSIHFLSWSGQFNVALALLLAAVVGVLLVAIPGSVRILQLRRALRKNVPSDKRR